MHYSSFVSNFIGLRRQILLLADQPWQTYLLSSVARKLHELDGGLEIVICLTDYFTFIHGRDILEYLAAQPYLKVCTQEQNYISWQIKGNPPTKDLDTLLQNWETNNCHKRTLLEIEKCNAWVFGNERGKFFLKLDAPWRKQILWDTILWIEEILEHEYDLIISIERSTLPTNLINEVATKNGVKFLSFLPSRIQNRWIFRENLGIGMKLHDFNQLKTHSENKQGNHVASDLISQINNGKSGSYSSLQNLERSRFEMRKEFPFKSFAIAIRALLGRIFNRMYREKKNFPFHIIRLEQNLFKLTLLEIQKETIKFLHSIGLYEVGVKVPIDTEFFFWSLHTRPEGSVLATSSGIDEIEVLKKTCEILPPNIKLMVKESSEMFGIRDINFYAKLRRLPGVVLVDPYVNSYPFLQKCMGVLGLSGTVLLEAEMMNKPSYSFGRPEFDMILSGFRFSSVKDFVKSVHDGFAFDNQSLIQSYVTSILEEDETNLLFLDGLQVDGSTTEAQMKSKEIEITASSFANRILKVLTNGN